MKRLLSFALAMVMTVALCPSAFAAESGWTVKELEPWPYDNIIYTGGFSEGLAAVVIDAGNNAYRLGYIDKTGHEVIPCGIEASNRFYHSLHAFSEGLAAIYLDGKWGYIDRSGQTVIPIKYEQVSPFSGGLAVVQLHGRTGCIDRTGKEIVPCQYNDVRNFADEAVVAENISETSYRTYLHELTFFDKTGKRISERKYFYETETTYGKRSTLDFSDGPVPMYANINGEKEWSYIDGTGKEVICLNDRESWPTNYSVYEAYRFSEGIAIVRLRRQTGPEWYQYKNVLIDKTGQVIVALEKYYEIIRDFHDGMAAVKSGDYKWGFIDTTGTEVIPCGKYDSVEDFSDGMAKVQVTVEEENDYGQIIEKTNYGFIDVTGKEVIPCGKYDQVGDYNDGLVSVARNYAHGFVDKTGKEVVPLGKYMYSFFTNGFAVVKTANGETGNLVCGIIDITGQEVVPCKYDEISERTGDMLVVKQSEQYGLVDYTGQEILPCKYDDLSPFSEGIFGVTLDGRYSIISVTPTPMLSGSGTLGGELAWEINAGALTVTGPLGAEDMVVAACEDDAGRFIGAGVVRAGKTSAQLPKGTAAAKLMWLGAGLAPVCPCVEVGPVTS